MTPLRAVRVQRRDLQEDDVVEDLQDSLVVGRREGGGQASRPDCALPTSVEWIAWVIITTVRPWSSSAASSSAPETVRGVGEAALDGVQVVQPRVVPGRGDGEHDEWAPHGGGAEGVQRDAVAGAREGVVVRGEVVPVGEASLRAHREAEVGGGGGDLSAQRGRSGHAGGRKRDESADNPRPAAIAPRPGPSDLKPYSHS